MVGRAGKYRAFWILVGLAVITLAAFEPVRINAFVNYDDDRYVTDNIHVQRGLNWESVVWAFSSTHASNWHPLTWLSHMADCELFGLNPTGHHINSLVLHVINVLLLFWVCKRMTGALGASAFVAAVFALHPLRVESVAWVAERKDVLSAFFWMLTMFFYVRYVERPGVGRYLLVFSAFSLGLMAKPMLITLPFVLVLLDYWPLRRLRAGTEKSRAGPVKSRSVKGAGGALSLGRLIAEKIPLLAVAVVSATVTYLVQQGTGAMQAAQTWPLNVRIANALVSYVRYITKMFCPINLAVLYPHPGERLAAWQPILCLLILAGISWVIIAKRRRAPYAAVGWLWYLVTLLPVIGIVQVGTQAMADRYTYLPSIGIAVIVAWGAGELLGKWRYHKPVLAAAAVTVIVPLLLSTRAQLRHWRNSVSLCRHSLAVTENNYTMHSNLGNALESVGKLDEAAGHYRDALQINPDYANAHNNLGVVLQKRGNTDAAIRSYYTAIRIDPEYARAHNNLGIALRAQGNLDNAALHFRKALEAQADYAEAYSNLGTVLFAQAKPDEATSCFQQALAADAGHAPAHYNLGRVFQGQGKLQEAEEHYRQAVRLQPDYLNAHNNLGTALASQGKFEEAIKYFRRALEIDPNMAAAKRNLWKTQLLMDDQR